jgi:hypothetical protein
VVPSLPLIRQKTTSPRYASGTRPVKPLAMICGPDFARME